MLGEIRKPVEFIEASLKIPLRIHNAVCNFIIENYSGGILLEEEENSDEVGIKFHIPQTDGDGFLIELSGYINRLIPEISFEPQDIRTKIIKNIKWEDAYKESIRPMLVDNVIIRPPWISGDFDNKLELIIEPKMAFGTGSHETTKLCIKEILKYFKPGQTFFDLGCGSGILSILAARLGAGMVKGVDIDLISIQNARENILINKVHENVVIESGSIEKAIEDRPYDFLAANLIKSTILELYDKIHSAVKSGGIIVLSGLLSEDKEEIETMLTEHNVLKYDITQDGEWLVVMVVTR